MKAILKSVFARVLALLLTASVAFAQERGNFRQEELDQILAPIALYPDPLLSQILMASTYPLEVVQAARWSRSNSHLKGEDAVRAVEPMDWDPSVKSLVAFPQVLHRMDERLDWTQRLGDAFLAQEPQVMETIQGLRQKAAAAGNLAPSEQLRVTQQDGNIVIEPAHPEVVYVPYYDPAIVYGPWWWPAYPPVFWGPPPGYYVAPVYTPAFVWGGGIVISTGFFFGHCNWRQRHVTVVHKHVLVRRHVTVDKRHTTVTSDARRVAWRHDPAHRKGVPYRNASLRQEFGRNGPSGRDAWRDHRRPDPAPVARHGDGGRPAGFGDGRPHERRDASTRVHPGPDARGSRSAPPTGQSKDRRAERVRDATRVPSRSMAAQPAPTTAHPRAAGRQETVRERAPQPEARSFGDRGHFGRPVTPRRDSATAHHPSATVSQPAPRMGHRNHRGDAVVRSRGGQNFR
jgi:hypothetical protein